MARKHFNIESGTTDGSHDPSTTTITFAAGGEPGFDLDADQYVVLAWGRFSDTATVELIHLVGPYNAGTSAGTIRRGQEGVSEKSHTDGEEWRLVTTAQDLKKDIPFKPHSGNMFFAATQVELYDGTVGVWGYADDVLIPDGTSSSVTALSPVQDSSSNWGLKISATTTNPIETKAVVRREIDDASQLTFTRRVNTADTTFKVYVDGTELASETATSVDGADVSRTIDLPTGTQEVTFEVTASGSGLKDVDVTDPTITPNEDPEIGRLYVDELDHLWNYKGSGEYEVLTTGGVVLHSDSEAIGRLAVTTKDNQIVLGTSQEVTTVTGGLELSTYTVSSATTIDATQKETVVLADASGGGFTVTLPFEDAGRVIIVKKIDSSANAVTVQASGATPATIDGSSSQTLAAQYNIMRLISDGANWFLI